MKPISKDINRKIYYYLFLLLAFCIPVHERITALVIALIALNWIAEFNFHEKLRLLKNSRQRKLTLLFGIFYIIYFAGTLYSQNLYGPDGAFFDLEIKLSLLFFPLVISTINDELFSSKTVDKILFAFAIGCFASGILLIATAAFRYCQGSDTSVFYYTGLSGAHHPSYLALYLSFSVIILIRKLIDEKGIGRLKRFLIIMIILIQEEMIVLLSSKAGIIGLALACLVYILFILLGGKTRKLRPVSVVALLMFCFLIFNISSPQTYKRFFEAGKVLDAEESPKKDAEASSEIRILIWKSALEIIGEHPVTGVGTGDVKPALLQKYSEKGYQLALAERLNAHNQYLQTYIATGIFGFLMLSSGFLLPLILSFKRKNLLYMVFIILFGFHVLVESMLERQAGVVFYAFFNALLFSNLVTVLPVKAWEIGKIG